MAVARPEIFTIPSGISFVRALAEGIVAEHGTDPLFLADVTIYVPTRRSVRALREAFLSVLQGAALGPNIHALGDVDEQEMSISAGADELEMPVAIATLRRKFLLAQLVQKWSVSRGESIGIAQAITYADALAKFLDEASAQRVDLTALKDLAPLSLAEHWEQIIIFLDIIAKAWPAILVTEGAVDPAERRDRLLRTQADRLKRGLGKAPIYAAGSTGSIPATAELLKTIAYLPNGAVILPGLDIDLDPEAWNALDQGHAQYGLHQLLTTIGGDREDVKLWPWPKKSSANAARNYVLSEALRPPPTTDAWHTAIAKKHDILAAGLSGISFVEAANPREEAQIVALALRDAVESPGRSAALVTPDRGLARRVSNELLRWNISIDDSAGKPLSHTPPGTFLTLLIQAAAERFAPVSLLALLKHPLAAGGQNRVAFLNRVREFEYAVLRGIRPAPGLDGLSRALHAKVAGKKADPSLQSWFEGLRALLVPLEHILTEPHITIAGLADAHGRVAETLAANDIRSGASELWRGPAGESAALLFAEMIEHGVDISLGAPSSYAEIFQALAGQNAVRAPYGQHPRLFILGPLEARLQYFDFLVLGGLNEGVWPQSAATDPWLSRPMRKAVGLDLPERRVGLAAHDFSSLASCPDVLVTRSVKQDGSPAIASRWWQRIQQLAKGLRSKNLLQSDKPYHSWVSALDFAPPSGAVKRPSPKPPVADRPRRLSVTEIETWLRDPYAIYAKHILKLRALDPIDAEPGARERGTAIHAVVENFFKAYPDDLPSNALEILHRMGHEAFVKAGTSPALLAIWQPRFKRAAAWFLANERTRRQNAARIVVEQRGQITLSGPEGPFTLIGRADRIDFRYDGSVDIVDYKSGGRLPGHKEVNRLLNPQLPLEAAMLLRDGFTGLSASRIGGLVYLQLTGGDPPGQERIIDADNTAITLQAVARLESLIARYDAPSQGYLSRYLPFSVTSTGDYDHLARIREWHILGVDGE